MKTFYEIPIEQDALYLMIRDECFKQYHSFETCRLISDGKNERFRTDQQRFAEIAKEITGLDWVIKEYPVPVNENPPDYKGFAWGT